MAMQRKSWGGGVINEGIAISYTVIKMNAFDL